MRHKVIISYSLCLVLFLMVSACATTDKDLKAITPLPSSTVTNTPQPTSTPVPTNTPPPTPTIDFPVLNDTPIPQLVFPALSIGNSGQLVEIAKFGYPVMYSWQMLKSVDEIAVVFSDKIQFVSMSDKEVLREINVELKPNQGFAVSADGSYVAGISRQGNVGIWSKENQKVFEYIPENIKPFGLSAGISTDGSLLAVSSCENEYDMYSGSYSCDVKIIDWRSGNTVKKVRGSSPSFTHDGLYLIVAFDKKIQFYSTLDWKILNFLGEPQISWSLKFSPDGDKFALITNTTIEIYDLQSFRLIRYLDIAIITHGVSPAVIFSMDGERLLLFYWGDQKPVYLLYEIKTGNTLDYDGREYGIPDCSWLAEGDSIDGYGYQQSRDFVTNEYFPEIPNKTEGFEFKATSVEYMFDLLLNSKVVASINGLEYNSVIAHSGDLVLVVSHVRGPGKAFMQIVDLSTGKRIARWEKGISGDCCGNPDLVIGDKWWGFIVSPYRLSTYVDESDLIVYDFIEKMILIEKKSIDTTPILLENQSLVGLFDLTDCLTLIDPNEGKKKDKIC